MDKLLDSIITRFVQTQEYQGFGWNILTFGALCAAGTLLLEIWGLSKQITTSSMSQDASVVSVTKKCIVTAYFFTVFNYGLVIKSLSLWGSLVIGVLQFIIVMQLWKIKRFLWWEWLAALCCTIIVMCSLITPWKTELFFIVAIILLPPGLAMQPLEMLRAKSRTGLAPQDPLSFLISSVIWVFYALALGSWLIAGASLLYASLYFWTLFLWTRYDPKSVATNDPAG